jgi:filamentous hemagglutinin
LSEKDVLNEYTYRTLNAQGPNLIALHSAGNEDARKALQAGALYGKTYENLSFVSLGSPVSNSIMRQSVTAAGANYLGQVTDWRDPVTYSKTAGGVVIGSGVAGLSVGAWSGASYGAGIGAGLGPLGAIAGGAVGGVELEQVRIAALLGGVVDGDDWRAVDSSHLTQQQSHELLKFKIRDKASFVEF